MDALQLLLKGVVVVFVVSSMLSIGLAARGAEIVAPLRHPVWVLRALIANFVLAPAVALAITAVLPLDPGYALGLLLLGFAAGSPLLPKLAEAGRTDVASATALMVLLMAGSVVVMPLALPLLVKGVQVNPLRIAAPLVVLMLAPLLLGMAGQRFAPEAGAKVLPAVTRTSNIGFVAVVILICGTNLTALTGVLGSGAIGQRFCSWCCCSLARGHLPSRSRPGADCSAMPLPAAMSARRWSPPGRVPPSPRLPSC